MARVRIIYSFEGWAYHNRALALQKYAPADFDVSIASLHRPDRVDDALGEAPPDLVFLLPPCQTRNVRQVLSARAWPTKLVGAHNSGWRRIEEFVVTCREADAVIVNSRCVWERCGRPPSTHMIPNGVDLEIFRVRTPPADRTPKVLWVGSVIARKRKRYDDLILPLQAELRRLGIECETLLVDPYGDGKRSPEEMAEWYNRGTILVCASEIEGTPNPALEAAACGCTVVTTAVGNMPDLIRHRVNGYLVDAEVSALVHAVVQATRDYRRLSAAMQSDIRSWSWKARAQDYFRVFSHVLNHSWARHVTPPEGAQAALSG